MAKCRSLLQENQDLGKQISQGRVAQLEAELAIQKKYNQEIVETQEG
jgi:parvulin-like peptidyl-prolyl isomerase